MKTHITLAALSAMAALFAATSLRAAETGASVNDEDLLLAENPIIIKSRLRINNEFSEVGGGGHRDKLILGGAYGFGFRGDHRDYGIGFELPFLFNDPAGGGSSEGIGDFKLRVGKKFLDDAKWRAGMFFDTEFDTSADAVRAIANQRTQMAAGGGVSYAIWDSFVLTSTLQYGWSLDDGETTGRKSEWEAHLTATVKPVDFVAINLDYKAVINTVDATTLYSTLEPSIGWTIGAKRNIGLFASWELPIDETNTNWTAKAGVTWFF